MDVLCSDSLTAGNLGAELDSWGDLWTLGAPSYPTAVDKISSDAFSVSTIAAISLGTIIGSVFC